jgi:hypothetical protein
MKTSRHFESRLPPHNGYGLRDTNNQPLNVEPIFGANAARIKVILEGGTVYWLSTNLGVPASTARVQAQTVAVSADLVVIGAQSNLYLSTIEIEDQGTSILLTNSTTPLSAVAGRATLEPGIKYWPRPYLLKAQTMFKFNVTGDGTESGGFLALICLRLPDGQ